MGYTNETAHYGLPLPLGSDKTTPMDYNTSLEAVDTALFGAVSDCASFDTRLDTAEGNISTAQGDITNLDTRLGTAEGKISTLEGTATSQGNEIKDVRSDCEDMITAYNEASATSTHAYSVGDYFIYNDVLYKATNAIAIGDTIVPDTNCTTTNVTTEINQINTALYGLDYVEVTGDGIKTHSQILDSLYALIDKSKITRNSKLVRIATNNTQYYNLSVATDSVIDVEHVGNSVVTTIRLLTSGSTFHAVTLNSDNTISFNDYGATPLASGVKFRFAY